MAALTRQPRSSAPTAAPDVAITIRAVGDDVRVLHPILPMAFLRHGHRPPDQPEIIDDGSP